MQGRNEDTRTEFRQPQAVLSAYMYKLSKLPPVKRQISERFISFSATISALGGVFWALHHHPYFPSASLLGQATQKIPPHSWKDLDQCISWRTTRIVRHNSNSMIGSRTKQRHMRELKCPQENWKPKTATNLLLLSEWRPEPKNLRQPAPIKQHQ